MKDKVGINLGMMEGRTFILGREGHIYIDSTTASKHHAEIKIKDGKIFLRDLDSTNGTFLVRNDTLVQFLEGYVNPNQPVVIGSDTYVIENLLAIASEFVSIDDSDTQIELSEESKKRRANG